MKILFLGDVMGRGGRAAVEREIPRLRAVWKLDFVVVNGENAAGGRGITPKIAIALMRAGAAVCVTGAVIANFFSPLFLPKM